MPLPSRDVQRVLAKSNLTVDDFPVLDIPGCGFAVLSAWQLCPEKSPAFVLARVMKLYAPLYVSNECVNACLYCGFNVHNKLARVTLSRDEVLREAEAIHRLGFRHLLLVSGEAQNKVTLDYLDGYCA